MSAAVERYSLSMRVMHWVVALLVISMLAAGSLMIRSLEPWQPSLLMLHKSTGLLVLLLVLLRLLMRFRQAIPAPLTTSSRWQRVAASVTHGSLYLLLITLPLSGFLMQYAAAKPVSVYGWFTLPAAITTHIEYFAVWRELHSMLTQCLAVLICVHVAAALHHQWVKKYPLLRRMW